MRAKWKERKTSLATAPRPFKPFTFLLIFHSFLQLNDFNIVRSTLLPPNCGI